MAAKRVHVMTPARKAALKKAQAAAIRSRRRYRLSKNRGHAPKASNRGIGVSGLKKEFHAIRSRQQAQPNYRLQCRNDHSWDGQAHRLWRVQSCRDTHRHNSLDMMIDRATSSIAPKGSRQRNAMKFLKKNVAVSNPTIRAKIGGAEVRLGTSRGAGPTIIVRRGRHKISQMLPISRSNDMTLKLKNFMLGDRVSQERKGETRINDGFV